MSVSADGFIARLDGDSDWVSQIDSDLFLKRVSEARCLIMGRRTFEQFQGSLYPVKDVCNIVLSSKSKSKNREGNAFFVSSPTEAVGLAKEKGYKEVLLAGGGHTNGSFLNAGLIDEIFLSVHPLILNDGMRLFEGNEKDAKIELVDTRKMGDGLVELHYKVIS